MGARLRLAHTPASLGYAVTWTRLVGLLLRDMVLTRDEVDGMMAGLLISGAAGGGNYPPGRLAYRQCRCSGVAVHVRTAAEFQPERLSAKWGLM